MFNNPWYIWVMCVGVVCVICLVIYLKVIGFTIG